MRWRWGREGLRFLRLRRLPRRVSSSVGIIFCSAPRRLAIHLLTWTARVPFGSSEPAAATTESPAPRLPSTLASSPCRRKGANQRLYLLCAGRL
eukprot:7457258-Pyramimonas_sp.AAC.1